MVNPLAAEQLVCVCGHHAGLHWFDDGEKPTGRCDVANCGCARYRPTQAPLTSKTDLDLTRLRSVFNGEHRTGTWTRAHTAELFQIVERLRSAHETAASQAPIAWIEVGDTGAILASDMYAPGLPPGTHDLYCEPMERVPPVKVHACTCLTHEQVKACERNCNMPTARRTLKAFERRKGCHRSHPHELMDAGCERLTEIAREQNRSAQKTDDYTKRGEVMNPPASAALGAEAGNLNTPQRHGLGPSPRGAEARPADASPVPTCQHDVLSEPNTIGIVHEQGRDKFACTVCKRRAFLVRRPGDPRGGSHG